MALMVASGASYAQSDAPLPDSEPLDLSKLDPTIDWSVLNTDASSFAGSATYGKNITVVPTQRSLTKWSRTDSAVTVNRPLPTAWDTKVGVDFGLATTPSPSPLLTPNRLVAGTSAQSSGAAWVNTTAPALNLPLGWDKASLDARFDPMQDQSKFGTRFSRSLPLGEEMSVTMESGFAVTHLRSQPLPNDLTSGAPVNVFDADRLAKLNSSPPAPVLAQAAANPAWMTYG
jgi:hypothetical protein